MKTVRLISGILRYASRITAWGYLLTFLYASASLATGWCLHLTEQQQRFVICYPFTVQPFLLGEYQSGYILMFLLLLGLYALFFFLVGNVFRVFTKIRLFTPFGVNQLRRFYVANLVLPLCAAMVVFPFYTLDSTVPILITLHAILGIFTYFMAAIFRQGLALQDEQDLII